MAKKLVQLRSELNRLHDHRLVAWAIDRSNWMMIFDIENPTRSIKQEFRNVIKWYVRSIRSPFCVLEMFVWKIDNKLFEIDRAANAWGEVFGFVCDINKMDEYSHSLIEEHNGKFLVSFATTDDGILNLVCAGIEQAAMTGPVY